MEWDLENQEHVGVEERGKAAGEARKINKKLLRYAGLVLVVLFALMLMLAKR